MQTPEFLGKLSSIQANVKVPKTKYNQHGKYYYRDLESILTTLNPLLRENGLTMWMTDSVTEVAGVPHVVATVIITDGESSLEVHGWAQECQEQKGMAPAQITGACSSYARKYALNALFLLDDVQDDDAREVDRGKESNNPPSGDFNARCQTCGRAYHFESREQYAGFIESLKERPCCQQPSWKVI